MEPATRLVAFVLLSSFLTPIPRPEAPRVVPADVVYQLLTNPGFELYDAPYGQYQDIPCQVDEVGQDYQDDVYITRPAEPTTVQPGNQDGAEGHHVIHR